MSTPETSSLSAVVSRNEPSLLVTFQRRASRPSTQSVTAATANSTAAERRRVVAVVGDQDQGHDHRRQHDPQHRAGGDEAGRAESAPGHGRGRHEVRGG